jgi:signal transduction histidine kinase
MKFKLFYSPFLVLFVLIWMVSCTQNKSAASLKTGQLIDKIHLSLANSQSEGLSKVQKLDYLNQAQRLAQQSGIDSLVLKTFDEKVAFYNRFYPDSTLTVLKEFEKLSHSQKNSLHIAHSYLNLGEYYFNLQQKNTAFNYFNKSSVAFKDSKDSSNVVYSLLMLSGILKEKSDYYDMEAINTEALKFISPTDKNYQYNYSCVYNNLGIAYKQNFDYDNSLLFYKKARQYAQNDFAIMTLENNIAAVYTLSNRPQKALNILLALEQSKSKSKNACIDALISNNIGLAYLKLKDSKSLDYFLKGLSLRQKGNNTQGLIDSYNHLANYYKTNTITIPLAKKYAQKSYKEATKMGLAEERLTALELLSTTSSGAISNEYLKIYFKLNDSLVKVKQKNKNQFAKIRYDFSQQMAQNQLLKTQKVEQNLKIATSQNQILLLLILGVISIALAYLRFNYLKQKSKKEILQEGYNTETRISKQLHDELANDVYHVMTFAETQSLDDANNKETLLNNLDTIYKRTRNISKENSNIDTGKDFEFHLKEMMVTFSSSEVNVLINGIDSIPFSAIESPKKIVIYRVLQELLVNMKKHSQCNIVVISFEKKENIIQINYSDNGIGTTKKQIVLKNGLLNVENRIKAINGKLNFDTASQKGFKASFHFPI